jgi:hypothetical protein
MQEIILSNAHQSEVSNIDLESGIILGVKEANLGLNKNGYFFTEELLNGLMEQGNQGAGIKSRFGHPTQGLESLGTYIGRKKNFRIENGSLYSDLHLDPLTKDTMVNGTSTFNFIIKMAQSNPDMLGCSVVFSASVEEVEIEGANQLVPKLIKFTASDLVDEPAATDHLFNSQSTNNSDMNKLQKAIEVLKLSFNTALETLNNEEVAENELASDVVETLDTGLQVTVSTDETDIPKEGDAVNLTEGGEPAPDGTHLTESGLEIVTEGGLIVSIVEVEDVAEVEAPEVEAEVLANGVTLASLAESVTAMEAKSAEFMENTTASIVEALEVITKAGEARDIAFSEMKKNQNILAASVKSKDLEFAAKEELPSSKALNEVESYLASRKSK